MNFTYNITGMTCSSCEAFIKGALAAIPGVSSAEVSKDSHFGVLTADAPPALDILQNAIGGPQSKYQIKPAMQTVVVEEEKRSWFDTYKPVLLLFGMIATVSSIVAMPASGFNAMVWMNTFMAGFFLAFSFFKLINLKAFADSYAMYDIVAKQFKAWGYIYAFIELGLGLAFVLNFEPVITNAITLVVMSVSIIGVLQSVLNKRKIQCACLGAVFNLPMSTLTIIEDAIMIAMSAVMLVMLMA